MRMFHFSFRKLLKEHHSKYEKLDEGESYRIMEEILSMKIGINPDQVIGCLIKHPATNF